MELENEIQGIKNQMKELAKVYSENLQDQNTWRASQLKLLSQNWEDREKENWEKIKLIDEKYREKQDELLKEIGLLDSKIDNEIAVRKNGQRQLLIQIFFIFVLFLIVTVMVTIMLNYKIRT